MPLGTIVIDILCTALRKVKKTFPITMYLLAGHTLNSEHQVNKHRLNLRTCLYTVVHAY